MNDTRQQILLLLDASNSISSRTFGSISYDTQDVTNSLLNSISSMQLDLSNLYNTPILFPGSYSHVEPHYESIPSSSSEAVRVFNTLRSDSDDKPVDTHAYYHAPPMYADHYGEPMYADHYGEPEPVPDIDDTHANISSELQDIYTKLDDIEQSQFNMNQRNNEITASMLQSIGEGKNVTAPDPYNRYEFDGYIGNQDIYSPNIQ